MKQVEWVSSWYETISGLSSPFAPDFAHVALYKSVVIWPFRLVAYTFTYNFRVNVARWFRPIVGCS